VIATYVKLEDAKMVDDMYEVFSPYWMTSLGVRMEAIQTHLDSLEEKEFPNAKNAKPKDFIDKPFVDKPSKSGFVP
jgi:hypothetical protein